MSEEYTPTIAMEIPSELRTSSFAESTLSAYEELTQKEEAVPILGLYAEILEIGDASVQKTAEALHAIHGTQLIPAVAKENIAKQAGRLLIGATELGGKGSATVSLFGRYTTLHSLEEIVTHLAAIKDDLTIVASLPEDRFLEDGLQTIDTYLFDDSESEAAEKPTPKVFVFENPNNSQPPRLSEQLLKEGVVNQQAKIQSLFAEERPFDNNDIVTASSTLLAELGLTQVIERGGLVPDIVMVDVTSFSESLPGLQALFTDYMTTLQPSQRPVVIVQTHGIDIPLSETSSYPGFLFCTDMDQLRNTFSIAVDLAHLRKATPQIEPAVLALEQEKQYDASSDLREWELITAKTKESLYYTLRAFQQRENDVGAQVPEELKKILRAQQGRVTTILDLGTGDGRIAGMLARVGVNVVGLDISQEQLNRGEERFVEEGRGLRGELVDPTLSYNALRQLADDGVVSQDDLIIDDNEARKRYVTVKSDFMHLHAALNQLVKNWDTLHSDSDKFDFFPKALYRPEAFKNPFEQSDPRHDGWDYFTDIGFDAVTIHWNTFCELDFDKQQAVLGQILNVLNPGGILIMEIPDRMVDPYAAFIREYHQTHPNERYGTHAQEDIHHATLMEEEK